MKHSYLQGFLLTITIYIGYCMLIININSKVYLDGSKKKKRNTKKQTKSEVESTKLGNMTREEEGQSVVEKPVLYRSTWVVFP